MFESPHQLQKTPRAATVLGVFFFSQRILPVSNGLVTSEELIRKNTRQSTWQQSKGRLVMGRPASPPASRCPIGGHRLRRQVCTRAWAMRSAMGAGTLPPKRPAARLSILPSSSCSIYSLRYVLLSIVLSSCFSEWGIGSGFRPIEVAVRMGIKAVLHVVRGIQ